MVGHDAGRSLPVPRPGYVPVWRDRPLDLITAGALTLGAIAAGALAAGAVTVGRLALNEIVFGRGRHRAPSRREAWPGEIVLEELIIARLRVREFTRLPRDQ